MRTFVISLKSSDRRLSIAKELEQYQFEFIDAIDGNNLPDSYLEKINKDNYDYWLRKYGRPLSKGEIGCSLSHHFIYKKMISENIEWALIFEDDIYTSHVNFQQLLDDKKLYKNYIYILGSQDGINNRKTFMFSPFFKIKLTNGIKLRRVLNLISYPQRTASYVINKSTAQKLLAFNNDYLSQADDWVAFLKNSCFKGLYYTDVIRHPDISKNPTQSLLQADRFALENEFIKNNNNSNNNNFFIRTFNRWRRSILKKVCKISDILF